LGLFITYSPLLNFYSFLLLIFSLLLLQSLQQAALLALATAPAVDWQDDDDDDDDGDTYVRGGSSNGSSWSERKGDDTNSSSSSSSDSSSSSSSSGDGINRAEERGRHPVNKKQHMDVVMCASLLTKVPNLAGLTRTCEILGVRQLAVGDIRVTADGMYRAIGE
jgi:hypothetical protein